NESTADIVVRQNYAQIRERFSAPASANSQIGAGWTRGAAMYRRSLFAAGLAVGTIWALAGAAAMAETVAIIGTGNVGAALGQRFAAVGHEVVYGSREPDRSDVRQLVEASGPSASAATPGVAAEGADFIVLAVPWEVVEQVTRGLGDLSGRIVVDPTNPRVVADDGLRDY